MTVLLCVVGHVIFDFRRVIVAGHVTWFRAGSVAFVVDAGFALRLPFVAFAGSDAVLFCPVI